MQASPSFAVEDEDATLSEPLAPLVPTASRPPFRRPLEAAAFTSERWPPSPRNGWPPSRRNHWPASLGIRIETDYSILRGKIAQGIDPTQATAQETGQPAKIVAAELLPEDLRPLFPQGVVEGTVGSLLCSFLTWAKTEIAPATYRNYRGSVRTYVLSRYGATPLALFGQEDVRALLSDITLKRKAPTSAREVKKVLSAAFNWGKAHERGVKGNPAQGLKTAVPTKGSRWLTDEELVTFFRALPQLRDSSAADLYLLILSSLCRPGEAFSMRAEDVTKIGEERVWRLSGTKNGKDFLIPLQGPIAEVISRRWDAVGGKGYLFWQYNEVTLAYPYQLAQATRELRTLARFPTSFRPHDLRRTGRTHLSSLGVREEVAEAAMNHVQDDIKQTYNLYTYWPERKAALALWHEKLDSLRQQALRAAA